MTIQSERTGASMVMTLAGRLDTATAPQLERKIRQWGDEITELTLDFMELTYISSMGLRVLLQTQKALSARGRKLVIKNMNDSVREVFEMTGFIKLMEREEKFVVIRKDESGHITLSLIGQLDPDDVPGLAKELSAIKEAGQVSNAVTVLALDAAKLRCISAGAGRMLRRTIEDTHWEKRKLSIRGVSAELKPVFEADGMGVLLE